MEDEFFVDCLITYNIERMILDKFDIYIISLINSMT